MRSCSNMQRTEITNPGAGNVRSSADSVRLPDGPDAVVCSRFVAQIRALCDGIGRRSTPTVVRRACLVAFLASCGDNTPVVVERTTVAEVPAVANRNLDLLFVIDDSDAESSFNLSGSVGSLFDRLTLTGLPDLHVGVVSTDLGTSTSTSAPAPDVGTVGQGGCSSIGDGGNLTIGQLEQGVADGVFLTDFAFPDGTRQQNYEGELAAVVGKMVRLGATGCGFEQPLAAMRAALDNNPNNPGFLRDDALLAIIFVGDEDDCSVRDPALFGPDEPSSSLQSFRCTRFGVTCLDGGNTPDEMNQTGRKSACGPNTSDTALLDDPAQFRDFLVELKGDPRRVVVGGIFGDPQPFVIRTFTIGGTPQSALGHSCIYAGPDDIPNTSDDDVADPGVRLQAFADLFPDRSSTSSVCSNDLSDPLERIAQRIAFAMGSPCIADPLADSDPELAGLQPDCIVEDLVGNQATLILPCPASPTCWELLADEASCPLFEHLKLEVTRESSPDPSTITRARCAL
jgi:hypothetical protein